MNTNTALKALALALLPMLAVPAFAKPAAVVPACSFGDLSGVTVTACTGFVQGNLLQGNTGSTVSTTIAAQLTALGMANASTATYIEKIGSLDGGFIVDFNAPLVGDTIIGLHLGGGSNRFAANISSGATAFYKFNAGTNLNTFSLGANLSASSGVAIFQTSPVPEPETYALMLAGLVGVGFMARRRNA